MVDRDTDAFGRPKKRIGTRPRTRTGLWRGKSPEREQPEPKKAPPPPEEEKDEK